MSNESSYEQQPVTIIVSRVVKPGRAAEFEEWAHGISQAALAFEGHMGVHVIRPAAHAARREYALIFRFDTYDNLRRWAQSEVRRDWLKRVEPLIMGEPQTNIVSGMEFWFTMPDQPQPPPRYKMALVSWLAITPLSHFVPPLLAPLLGDAAPLLRTMLVAAVLIGLMTYVVMPFMTRLFRRWLFSA
ncbi:MAG: antibiotic biosynthesis monooxygenase [Chloroflexi bacterium]|nr:antibiotic biosynthesis monooxygenase [Chloroflexota bacterium]